MSIFVTDFWYALDSTSHVLFFFLSGLFYLFLWDTKLEILAPLAYGSALQHSKNNPFFRHEDKTGEERNLVILNITHTNNHINGEISRRDLFIDTVVY